MPSIPHHASHRLLLAATLGTTLVTIPVANALADDVALPPISIGGGIRTSFTNTNYSGNIADVNDFALNSARIYISGKVTDQIGFMFNTEYDGSTTKPIDAVAQFSLSDQVNIWAGRFLPPSDRANLYGPYYASNWGTFQDGVQDGYPSVTTGRDDGVAYWGQFGMTKLSFGVFDIPSTLGTKDVLYAGRAQIDLWDPEGGYYLNGTYYGAKDLLAIGVAAQAVGSDKAYTADLLLEKKLPGMGVVTLEAEYGKYDGLGGYTGNKSDGYYALAAYLFPTVVGGGKFQLLGKYGEVKYDFTTYDVKQKTSEVDLNYLIKTFNARVSLFYINKSYDRTLVDARELGLGLQIQL